MLHPDSSRPRRVSNRQIYGEDISRNVAWVDVLRNGDVGVATHSGFYLHHFATKAFSEVTIDTFPPLDISTFTETRDGTLWVSAARRELIAYNRSSGSVRRYMPYRHNPATQLNNWVNRIAEDTQGRIWAAANDGVYRLDASDLPPDFRT